MSKDFVSLGLSSPLPETLEELGYAEPTPIQSSVIPVMLGGSDLIGQAQTGTGKTAAFALPVLQSLEKGRKGVKCIVLAPTRELALQVCESFKKYGKNTHFHILPVYGGTAYNEQIRGLRSGADIVVGTPGRVLDLINKGKMDLSGLTHFILDEADEMLSMGFLDDMNAIMEATPAEKQTALFSATMPAAIRQMADNYLHEPEMIQIKAKQKTVEKIDQSYYLVKESQKTAAMTRIFEMEEIQTAIVFARTRISTDRIASELTLRGFPSEALNGDLSQDVRQRIMNRFRNNQIKVLVATDVAARGLDVDHISHVINYDLPNDAEVYVHRVGRTGRAGREGTAISLVSPGEKYHLRRIEKFTNQKIPQGAIPTEEEINAHREESFMNKINMWIQRGRCSREKEIVAELEKQGHEPMLIAAICLKLARAEEKQRPILPISPIENFIEKPQGRRRGRRDTQGHRVSATPHKRSREKGMVSLVLNTGKKHGTKVNHIVSTISRHADIPGNSLGKIKIGDDKTQVDVPNEYAGKVLNTTLKIGKQRIKPEKS